MTILEIQSAVEGFPEPKLGFPKVGYPSRFTWPDRQGSCLDTESFLRVCSRFRIPTTAEKRSLFWRSSDALVERSSGRIVLGTQHNTIEEHMFQCRVNLYFKQWELPFDLFVKKAVDPRYWSTDIPYRVLWAFEDFPKLSDRVELEYGPVGSAEYWKGMVHWCSFA